MHQVCEHGLKEASVHPFVRPLSYDPQRLCEVNKKVSLPGAERLLGKKRSGMAKVLVGVLFRMFLNALLAVLLALQFPVVHPVG